MRDTEGERKSKRHRETVTEEERHRGYTHDERKEKTKEDISRDREAGKETEGLAHHSDSE